MEVVTLNCAIVGEGSVFSIVYDEKLTVAFLKKAIKAEKRQRIQCDADKLTLFLAKKDGAWLTENEVKGVRDTRGLKPLNFALARLPRVGLPKVDVAVREEEWERLEEEAAAGNGRVHVLVKVPEQTEVFSPNKRARSEDVVVTIEKVPQIDIQNVDFVTLPAAFVAMTGLVSGGDLMLYCRPQVHELWGFLREEVVAKNSRGFIVGPPGTGKSACTLSFVASLDHEEWNVVWIHLGKNINSCLAIGSKQYWRFEDLASFVLPRVDGKKLFVCLDGFKDGISDYGAFYKKLFVRLHAEDRLVICSSMATLGKRNQEDDDFVGIQFFFMYSWTQDEYLAAIAHEDFYDTVASTFDATSVSEVNDEGDNEVEELDEAARKKHAFDLKFYYAGGSCRFMFQYPTVRVKYILKRAVDSTANKSDLVKYCGGAFHADAINRLYGMQRDGPDGGRFPVSGYVTSLFANACGEEAIVQLVERLGASDNPSLDGHLFEWLFLASVRKRKVKLLGDQQVVNELPQANVLRFDPKKRFKVLPDGSIRGDRSWLQPAAWNQGGYDAVYFDTESGEVIFIQVTRSDKHDFKMRYFFEVLFKLKQARMNILTVEIFFVVKTTQYLNFELANIDDRDILENFDVRWTRPEEMRVKVRAFDRTDEARL